MLILAKYIRNLTKMRTYQRLRACNNTDIVIDIGVLICIPVGARILKLVKTIIVNTFQSTYP